MDTGVTERQARLWLSEPRYERLLETGDGDHCSAIALQWNAELSASSFMLIHHFEILLRNTVDGVKRVITAIERLEKHKTITRGRVIASLSFAFWAGLFGRFYEELWRHRLRLAFPARESLVRTDVSARMKRLQGFRNRVAHHDSLLRQDVPARLEDMLTIAEWIDPAAQVWLEGASNALAIARAEPVGPAGCSS